ncbi:MAG: ATP-binding protein [Planctomycetales bacterium]
MCTNSLEAIGHGGRIEVSAQRSSEKSGNTVIISVVDDGPGLSPEQHRHLFDPFYSGREAGRGLGFGLSKCWRIIQNHGGRIEVESLPGKGATFRIRLPAA